jgi:uncharacterized protein
MATIGGDSGLALAIGLRAGRIRAVAIITLLVGLMLSAVPAAAQQRCGEGAVSGERVALLVGNGGYNDFEWPSLANAINDIELVCAALTKAGYTTRIIRDADRSVLIRKLDQFASEAATAKQVVIYYAGHGFEYGGRNWLVPMDAPPVARRGDLEGRFISIETMLEKVVPAGAFALVFVDACRTLEPVVRLADALPGDGIAPMGLLSLEQGAVFYSTAKGKPALDQAPVGSAFSPFAAAVVRQLAVPGLEIGDYFKVVTRDVFKTTRALSLGPQQPFHYGSWFDAIYLVPPPEITAAAAPVRPPSPIEGITLQRLSIEDEPVLLAEVLERTSAADILALAEGGDLLAQHLAGYMLQLGVGVRKDVVRAKAFLERAAAAGYAPAQQELSWLLLANEAGPAEIERARKLSEASSAAGFAKAKTHLAYRLATGRFGPPDFVRAEQLYLEAAEAGHPAAMFALTRFPAHQQANLARLKLLADDGNVEGNHWLCEAAFTANRLAETIADCTLAAQAGYAGSRAFLAFAYAKGLGVAVNDKEAVHWAKLARQLPELRADQRELIAFITE